MASNKSVEKAIKILELISKYPDGITLSGIYKALDMPKATVYDILQALYKEDAIYYKDPNQKTFVIGSKVFAIGQAYTKNSNFINYASPLLKQYADRHNLTVFACKRLADKTVGIYKYESPKTKISTEDVGYQQPLQYDIGGKVFLAFLPEERRKELLAGILKDDYSGVENSFYKKLVSDIEKIQKCGYGLDNGDTSSYLCSIALPVFNMDNKVSGVIKASRIIEKETEADIEKEISELKEIAEYVSRKQGYKK